MTQYLCPSHTFPNRTSLLSEVAAATWLLSLPARQARLSATWQQSGLIASALSTMLSLSSALGFWAIQCHWNNSWLGALRLKMASSACKSFLVVLRASFFLHFQVVILSWVFTRSSSGPFLLYRLTRDCRALCHFACKTEPLSKEDINFLSRSPYSQSYVSFCLIAQHYHHFTWFEHNLVCRQGRRSTGVHFSLPCSHISMM